MSTKHTPAPWIVIPGDRPSVQRGMEGGFCVYGKSRDREDADANLIAAAPDLLEALEKIWPFVQEDDGGFATTAYQEAINDVRAAIKKARGES